MRSGEWCIKARAFAVALAMTVGTAAGAQEFFDLTAEEVRIGDGLPIFQHSFDLGCHYADSVYRVAIEYPEFIDMAEADAELYRSLAEEYVASGNYPEVEVEPGEMPRMEQHIGVGRKRGTLTVSFVPVVRREGKYQKLVSFKLKVESGKAESGTEGEEESGSLSTTRAADSSDGRYADNSVLQSGTWAKIRVGETGIYQLTESLIKQAGFTDLSKVKIYGYGGNLVPETLTESYLTETDDLPEVATCTVDGKRLFYAYGPVYYEGSVGGGTDNLRVRNPYSDYGYYFLTQTDEEPMSVDSADFVAAFYPSAYYNNTLYEVDDYAWYAGGRNLYDSNLIGGAGESRSYTVAARQPGSGRVTVSLTAGAATSATIMVNDSTVGTMSFASCGEYDYATSTTASYKVGNLGETNTITVKQLSSGDMRLDYISIYSDVMGEAPSLEGTFSTPEYVYNITNQNMHSHTAVDMIIIIPTSQALLAQAERLKALHEENDGLSVRIVPADELFNEFSSGTPDASAYKRYVKMLYDRASEGSEPRYLVLFGDGAWDNRMLSTAWSGYDPDDFLLCYESENSLNKVSCFVTDDFYCMLDDGESLGSSSRYTGQPDIAVGRFPVRSTAQAKVMVDKVEKYMGSDIKGAWLNKIVFMGDDGNDNAHMNDAEMAAEVVEANYSGFDVRRIMWDAYDRESSTTGNSYPDVRNLVLEYMEDGALIMNYSGHGSETQLSHEIVVDINDFEDVESDALPMWITCSCDIMPYDGQEDNIGETAVLNEDGGAVVFYGTTRTVYQTYNSRMNQEIMGKLLATDDEGERLSVGEAIRQAKDTLASTSTTSGNRDYTSNKLHYTLLGDPALVLASPTMEAVVDSINGVAVADEDTLTLKVGNTVRVAGHVENAADMNGTVSVLVKGAKEEIICRLNDTSSDGADTAFVYYDRNSTIYSGSDSVTAGKFAFTFVVPKDINYDDGEGQIIMYAISDDKTRQAHGENSSVAFNGTGELATDSVGPSVYCYLNSSSFVNGGKVNSTPYFVAEITDASGINATGSGIGHDMQLTIDGKSSLTYSLNDYFEFDFGSYTSGTVGYSIPELDDGDHYLQFRVWDVLNNSTTSRLDFVVEANLEPKIISVEATKNPATTSTVFRIVHDRMGSDIDGIIELFDMAGRKLWTTTFEDSGSTSSTEVAWDLTIDGGRQLGTGVYLYRVRIACDGSNYASKANKLIVISNK